MTDSEKLTLLLEAVAGIKEDLTGMKTDINGMKFDFSNTKTDISTMKSDLSNAKIDIGDVKSGINNVKNDIKEMKSDISGIKITLDEVYENTQVLIDGWKTHSDSIDSLKQASADVERIRFQMDIVYPAVSDLSRRVQALEKKIS